MLRQVFTGSGVQHTPPPSLHLNFLSEVMDPRVTFSGGAGGTRVNSAGNIVAASCPRIDYDPVALACLGLLIEEQRTNLYTNSGDFTAASWTKFTATVTGNAATSPDGSANAAKLVANNGSPGYCIEGVAHTSGTAYTHSVFVKPAGRTIFTLIAQSNLFSDAIARSFNYTLTGNGSAAVVTGTGASATVTALANGWYRCTITYTPSASVSSGVQNRDNTGDGTNGFYLYGAHLEAASFADTYIPDTTVAVTRTADVAAILANLSAIWNGVSASGYAEFDVNSVIGTHPILSLDDNTANQQIRLYTSGTSLKLTVTDGGVTQADLTLGTVAANTAYKAAFRVGRNDFAAVMSAGSVQTAASGTVPTVNRLRIGSDQAANYQNGHAKKSRIYPSGLPNPQLQALVQ